MKATGIVCLVFLVTGCSTNEPVTPEAASASVTALSDVASHLPKDLTQANIIVVDVISSSQARVVLGRFQQTANRFTPMIYLNQRQSVENCALLVQAHVLSPPSVTPVMLNFFGASPKLLQDGQQKLAFGAFAEAFTNKLKNSSIRIAWLEASKPFLWTSYLTIH